MAQSSAIRSTVPLRLGAVREAIVDRLHREINTLVQSPEISDRIRKLGADPLTLSLAEFDAMIQRELEENARLIKAAGIKAN